MVLGFFVKIANTTSRIYKSVTLVFRNQEKWVFVYVNTKISHRAMHRHQKQKY